MTKKLIYSYWKNPSAFSRKGRGKISKFILDNLLETMDAEILCKKIKCKTVTLKKWKSGAVIPANYHTKNLVRVYLSAADTKPEKTSTADDAVGMAIVAALVYRVAVQYSPNPVDEAADIAKKLYEAVS